MSISDADINRKIAEHVMNLDFVKKDGLYLEHVGGMYEEILDYCNSWEAMGEVVEKMRNRFSSEAKWLIEISPAPKNYKVTAKVVIYRPIYKEWMTNDRKTVVIFNDSAPKAVALAALKAKGISFDES